MLFNTFLTTYYSDTTLSRHYLQGQLGSSSVKAVGGDRLLLLCKRKIVIIITLEPGLSEI